MKSIYLTFVLPFVDKVEVRVLRGLLAAEKRGSTLGGAPKRKSALECNHMKVGTVEGPYRPKRFGGEC